MALELDEFWLWDFWTVDDGSRYHVFYLKAPKSLVDPEQRHWTVTIGHAVSMDLTHWTVVDDAFGPGAAGEWDDYTTWTGSVVRLGNRWAMAYTGTCIDESGLVQRIGLAWSHDLLVWEKDAANPVLELDPLRYESLDKDLWHDQAWRDPWLFWDEGTQTLHALITARARSGRADRRGVIAAATTTNMTNWSVLDPITEPGIFGHLEIPQLIERCGRWYLLFSSPAAEPTPLARDVSLTGTHYLSADSPSGPFDWSSHGILLADPKVIWYGAKLAVTRAGEWVALAWRNVDDAGNFVGALSDPMPVTWNEDGPEAIPPSM